MWNNRQNIFILQEKPKENFRVFTGCSEVRDLSLHTSEKGNVGLTLIEETSQRQTKLREYRNHNASE